MNNIGKLGIISMALLTCTVGIAGNKDRVGQAGASELRINPWAMSAGMAGANTAGVVGLEAASLNVAGLAFTRKTDLMFTRTSWLTGSEVNINAFGIGQRIGESSVLGLSVMSMNFGDLDVTTVNLPEGGQGTFSPQYLNLGLSYAKAFSDAIYGGLTVRTLSESMANATARGVSFDAGIRYVTGEYDNIKFGIALRNVGPKMKYSGDGLSTKVTYNSQEFTLAQRTEGFELPALLSIGVTYDLYVGMKTDSTGKKNDVSTVDHKVSLAGTFTSNSFGKDEILVGLEYGFRGMFKVRGGYRYETGVTSKDKVDLTNAFTGPTGGASVEVPLGAKGVRLGLDYAYRATISFSGTHSVGIRLNI